MENKTNIEFHIKGVETLKLDLIPLETELSTDTSFQFKVSVEHRVNLKNNLVMVYVKVIIYTSDLNSPHGEIIVNNIFSIKNLEILTEKKEDAKFSIQQNIVELLSSIAISTTRGVMAATFKGTYLHNAVLPVVDPKSLSKPGEGEGG